VGAGDLDHAIDFFTDHSTRLVAVCAEIAQAAVVSQALKGKEIDRIGGFECKVSGSIGSVDLVTGAAVLAGWIRVSSL
jgi:hypothetical protein